MVWPDQLKMTLGLLGKSNSKSFKHETTLFDDKKNRISYLSNGQTAVVHKDHKYYMYVMS